MNDIKEIIRGISEIGWLPVIVAVAIIVFAIYVLSSGVKGKYTDPNYQEPPGRGGNGLLGGFKGNGSQSSSIGPGARPGTGAGPDGGPGIGPGARPGTGAGPGAGTGAGPGGPGRFGPGGLF